MKKSADDEITTYRMYTNERRISSYAVETCVSAPWHSPLLDFHCSLFITGAFSPHQATLKLHLTVNCCEDGKGRVRSPPQLALASGSLELQRRFRGCSHPTGVPRSRLYLRPTHSGEIQGSVGAGPWYRDTKHPSARHAMPCAPGAGGLDQGRPVPPEAEAQQQPPRCPPTGSSSRAVQGMLRALHSLRSRTPGGRPPAPSLTLSTAALPTPYSLRR